MQIAIFDFDGTLYEEETFRLLMDHLKTHPVHHTKYKKFIRASMPLYIANKLKIYSTRRMKERLMQIYANCLLDISEKDIHTFFEELAVKMKPDFNEEVVARLKQHHEDGVYVMVLSGAYDLLLEKSLKNLPVDTFIGTTIPFKNGEIDGDTPLYPIQAERKNEMIEKFIVGKEIDWKNSYAYGDSLSDASVLELVGHPVVVQPEQSLENVALKRKWEVIA